MDALHAARRKVAELLQTAASSRYDDDASKLIWLERAVEAQREADRLNRERIDALPACKMCGRKVTTPCNDAEGYYEGGPWDGACESYARGRVSA